MSLKNAVWVVLFCLAFIGITWLGMLQIEKDMEKVYQVKFKTIEFQRDSVQHILDSVDAEAFRLNIDVNRYEVAFEIFAQRNPKGAEQYATIISEETE